MWNKEEDSYRELMNYAMRALSRRAHTVHEMQKKLKKRPHHTPKNEEKIIERLKELNLLNDEEFIQRNIEQYAEFRHYGPLKIAQKLYQKGIPVSTTKQYWQAAKLSEKSIAKEALQKYEKKLEGLTRQQRFNKRAQFLASRGFSPSVIFDLAKNYENP